MTQLIKMSKLTRKLTIISFAASFIILTLSILPDVAEARLYRNLKLGDVGEDVRELQTILNRDSRTRVASFGPGSLGQETDYFGQLTHNAVVRFQEVYASEVLWPLSLTVGTGYVGQMTRKRLYSLNLTGRSLSSSNSFSNSSPALASKPPRLFSVFPRSGPDGTTVTLRGEGFLPEGNKVYAGFDNLEAVPSSDGESISFVVRDPFPDDLVFPPHLLGKISDFTYGFAVENQNGRSNVLEFRLKNSKVNQGL